MATVATAAASTTTITTTVFTFSTRMWTVVLGPRRRKGCYQLVKNRLSSSSSLQLPLPSLQRQQTRAAIEACHRAHQPCHSMAATCLDGHHRVSTTISIHSSRNVSFSSLANQNQGDDNDDHADNNDIETSADDRWDQLFQRLLVYRQRHDGSTLVPQSYKSDPELGRWVKRQRSLYKHGKLPEHRLTLLEACGFWWDAREGTWQEQFLKLMDYKAEHHGSTLVPKRYRDAELAHWVGTQRKFRKEGRLAQDRIDRLNEIEFVWDPLEEAWETMFEEWKSYSCAKKQAREKNRGGVVSMSTKLADWVDVQRMYYIQNRLPDHRRERLTDAGLVLQPREESWLYMYDKLKSYVHQHGDALIPYEYPHDPALGRWVHTQRGTRRRTKPKRMPQRRIDALDELGFVWEVRSGGSGRDQKEEEEGPKDPNQ